MKGHIVRERIVHDEITYIISLQVPGGEGSAKTSLQQGRKIQTSTLKKLDQQHTLIQIMKVGYRGERH
jgi:hypothetical protein